MEKNKIWKGVKIGITVLLLIAVLGTLGGLLYKTLKPVEEVVPPIENKVALGEAFYSKAQIEIVNADNSLTKVDSLSFDDTKSNFSLRTNGERFCFFVLTFDEGVEVDNVNLDLSVLFAGGAGDNELVYTNLDYYNKVNFNCEFARFFNKGDIGTGRATSFSTLNCLAFSKAYIEYQSSISGKSLEEICVLLNYDYSLVSPLKSNQLLCELSFNMSNLQTKWCLDLNNFVLSGIKPVLL